MNRKQGKHTREEWQQIYIERGKKIHDNKYTYDKFVYERANARSIITCPIHGDWEQRPNDHVRGDGCPKCKYQRFIEKYADSRRSNTAEFISKATAIHKNRYFYDNVEYVNATTKVVISCPTHGKFSVTPDKHLSGIGCLKCSYGTSRNERKIQEWLDDNNISYEREKRFADLKGRTKNSRLRYDFWCPDYQLFIEYDGEHHFRPINIKGRFTNNYDAMIEQHNKIVESDRKKEKYAVEKGYTLVRISYTDQDNIDTILSHVFDRHR